MQKIILLSYNADISGLIKEALDDHSLNEYFNAHNSVSGFEIEFQRSSPDIVLLVIDQTQYNSFSIISEIKLYSENRIPIVAITDPLVELKTIEKLLSIDVPVILEYPFKKIEIVSIIKTLIKLRNSTKNIEKERLNLIEYSIVQNKNLLENEQRWDLILQSTNDGIWDWNIKTNELQTTKIWNSSLGYSDNSINTFDDFINLIHQDDKSSFNQLLKKYMNRDLKTFHSEFRLKCKSGKYRWFLYKGKAIWRKDKPIRMLGTQSDITERKQMMNQLDKMAYQDNLTQLPNRNLFYDRMKVAIAHAKRFNSLVAILYIDLDGFKEINDNFGHAIGDLLLKEVAKRLKESVRDIDTVARIGGDEFAIILFELYNENDIVIVSKRILTSLSLAFELEGNTAHISGSIGISLFPSDSGNYEDLLKKSDYAMYNAKKSGKNNYVFYSKIIDKKAKNRMEMENQLTQAIMKKQFKMYFQPIIQISTGKVVGVEALLRWHHPDKGVLLPNHFIDFFQDSGLILSINKWMLSQITEYQKKWHNLKYPTIKISVNFSDKEFYHQSFTRNLRQMTSQSSLNPYLFVVEIREDVLFRKLQKSQVILKELKKMGFRIAIDNFGTGFFSFKHLIDFNIDFIKIDLSFVQSSVNNPKVRRTIAAMSEMAHNLDYKIIAEGVETIEQLNLLNIMDYDELQGFIFSKALPSEDLEKIMNKNMYQIIDTSNLIK